MKNYKCNLGIIKENRVKFAAASKKKAIVNLKQNVNFSMILLTNKSLSNNNNNN